jgi:hypothetical protein
VAKRDDLADFDEGAKDYDAADRAEKMDSGPDSAVDPDDEIRKLFESAKEATVEERTKRQPEPPQETRQEEDLIPRSRYNELAEREKRLTEMLDTALRGKLEQPEPREPADPWAGLNEEDRNLAENLAPILDRYVERRLQERDRALQPIVDYANEQRGLSVVKKAVPGFDDDIYQEAQSRFNRMSADEQAYFRSPAGLEALASRIMRERSDGERAAQQPPAPPKRTNRAHTLSRSTPMEPANRHEVSAWDLPEEKFEEHLQRLKGGMRRGQNEPDSFLD